MKESNIQISSTIIRNKEICDSILCQVLYSVTIFGVISSLNVESNMKFQRRASRPSSGIDVMSVGVVVFTQGGEGDRERRRERR